MAASHGFSQEFQDYARAHPLSANTGSTTGRVALSGKTVHIADVLADPDYDALGHQEHGGYRTSLGVPLLSKGEPVGVFVLTRPEVKPFTARQIELVETFADQAVIAIENVRLFTRSAAREPEALQQQTATADVLKVISRFADRPAAGPAGRRRKCGAVLRHARLPSSPGRRGGLVVKAHYGPVPLDSALTADPRDGYARRSGVCRAQDIVQSTTSSPGVTNSPMAKRWPLRYGIVPRCDAADARRRGDRRLRDPTHRGAAVHRKGDRARQDIRRPGRDRHRECSPVRRSAGPHTRAGGIA